ENSHLKSDNQGSQLRECNRVTRKSGRALKHLYQNLDNILENTENIIKECMSITHGYHTHIMSVFDLHEYLSTTFTQSLQRPEESIISSRTGVTGSCELP
ncbi:hypothetical protein STEG23_012308, partial [Scotinomys teguina]